MLELGGQDSNQGDSLEAHENKQGLILDPSAWRSNQIVEKVVHDHFSELVQSQDSERHSEVEDRVQGSSHGFLEVVVQEDVHGWGEEFGSEQVHQHIVQFHKSSHEPVFLGSGGFGQID